MYVTMSKVLFLPCANELKYPEVSVARLRTYFQKKVLPGYKSEVLKKKEEEQAKAPTSSWTFRPEEISALVNLKDNILLEEDTAGKLSLLEGLAEDVGNNVYSSIDVDAKNISSFLTILRKSISVTF